MMSGRLCQLHAAVASGFGAFMFGSMNVWPSYTTPLYKSNSTPLSSRMTQGHESLLGSLPSLGVMLGTAVAGSLINALGRRNGGIFLSLLYVVVWTIIGVSSTVHLVLTARFLSGVPAGGFIILVPIFVSEVAEDSIRGALATAAMFFYCLGTLISYILGWLFKYQTIIWLQIALSILSTILIIMVVESPVYLLQKYRDKEARYSIAKYRGMPVSSIIVANEFLRLKQQVRPYAERILDTDSNPNNEKNEKDKFNCITRDETQSSSPVKLLFLSPVHRRAFFIVSASILLQLKQTTECSMLPFVESRIPTSSGLGKLSLSLGCMGLMPVQVYAKKVFSEMNPDRADMYSVLFALSLFLGCAAATFVADKAGRRILLISSSVFACLCLAGLGFLSGNKAYPGWASVLLILLFCFTFMFGAGTVPFILMAEMFIPEVQNLASILVMELLWFLNFIIIGLFPYMLDFYGIQGIFFTFACTSICTAVFAYYMIPETKGLSIEQIQILLRSRKNYWNTTLVVPAIS